MLWAREVGRTNRVKASEIGLYIGKRVTLVGWPITRKTIWTKQGLPMDFISFEDETALFETIFFPQTHERYRKLLYGQRPLVIYGMVQNSEGALSIEVTSIKTLGN
jgi:DNA polymerase III alpha subunit